MGDWTRTYFSTSLMEEAELDANGCSDWLCCPSPDPGLPSEAKMKLGVGRKESTPNPYRRYINAEAKAQTINKWLQQQFCTWRTPSWLKYRAIAIYCATWNARHHYEYLSCSHEPVSHIIMRKRASLEIPLPYPGSPIMLCFLMQCRQYAGKWSHAADGEKNELAVSACSQGQCRVVSLDCLRQSLEEVPEWVLLPCQLDAVAEVP